MKELLDRDCVMLDGKCDCPRREGQTFPDCKKYDVLDEDHPNTCRCEVCRFWGA